MPTYEVTHKPTGRRFRLTGDRPPDARQLDRIVMRSDQLAAQEDSDAVGLVQFGRHATDPEPQYSGGAATQGGLGLMQGFHQLGQQANTVLAELNRLNPLNDVAQAMGARPADVTAVTDQLQGAADVAGQSAQAIGQLRQETGGPQVVGDITAAGTSIIPSLAAAPAGFPAMVASAGLQSYGAALADATRHYAQQGFTDAEALDVARPEAAAAGLITSLVTAGFGRTGVEAAANAVKLGGFKPAVKEFFTQAGLEGTEEFIDQLGQEVATAYARGEGFQWGESFQHASQAGALGAVVGGVAQIPKAVSGVDKPLKDLSDDELIVTGNQSLAQAKSALAELRKMVSQRGEGQGAGGKGAELAPPAAAPTVNDGQLAQPIVGEFVEPPPAPIGDPGSELFPVPEGTAPSVPEPADLPQWAKPPKSSPPLYVAPGPEGTQSEVRQRDDGRFAVIVRDVDADQPMSEIMIFPTKEAAIAKADTIRETGKTKPAPAPPPLSPAPRPSPLQPVGDPGSGTFPIPESVAKQLDRVTVSPSPPETITGSNEREGSEMPAEGGVSPSPAATTYRKGQTLVMSPSGRFLKPQNVKFVQQDDTGATVYLPRSKQYVTIDPGLLSLPRAVATRKAADAALAKLPADERRQVRADAREFDRLLKTDGATLGYYDPNVELDDSGTGKRLAGIELTKARVRALRDLGAEIPENSTPIERAKLLPALKARIEQGEQAERFDEATKAGAVEVLPIMLEVGDTLTVEGEELTVQAVDAERNLVTLSDGQRFGVQQVSGDEVIYVEDVDQDESTDFLEGEDEPPAPAAPLTLEMHDDATLQAQKDKEAGQAADREAKGDMYERLHRRLSGSGGNLGQGDMFGMAGAEGVGTDDVDLFTPTSPAPRPTSRSSTKANIRADGPQYPGPAPEKPPGRGANLPPVDDPAYSAMPFGLPELVQLAKGLGKGKYPKLKARLRALRGGALGVFKSFKGIPDSGRIELKRDIFKLITDEERARLMQEADAQAERALPIDPAGETPEQINERTDLAAQIYDEKLGELTAERLEQEPVLGSKVLAHEIGHWIDFLPQALIDGRGNLLGRIASLKGYLKTTMSKDPKKAGEDLLDQKDRAALRRLAQRMNGPKPPAVKDGGFDEIRAQWLKDVRETYKKLVAQEIDQRGLMSLPDLKAELRPLIAWHNGTDEMSDYYESGEEMYAEAFSVFLTNPGAMAKRAPTYFRALVDFMERKPKVAALYEQIQNEIRTGANQDTRARNLRESFDRDTEAWRRRTEAAETEVAKDWVDNIIYHFDRRFGPVYRVARSYKRQGEVKEAVGSFLYRGAEHELFLGRMDREVGQLLVDHNLDWKDFGAYLFHRRIIDSEHDVANPLGFSANSSREALLRMAETLGEPAVQVLEQAQRRFRKLYEEMVVPLLQSSGLVSPELQKLIEERVYYATFSAVRGKPEKDIDQLLDAQFGAGVGSAIYRRVGNLGDVANPATATVTKALSLISAAHRNRAKLEVVKMLQEQEPDLIREADKRWTGRGFEYVQRGQPGDPVQTLTLLDGGKPKAFYVRNYIAEAFNTGNPIENRLFMKFLEASRVIKSLFTQWNPGFWSVNYLRDANGVYQQVPGMTMRQYVRLLPRAMRAARASLKHKTRNRDAEHALREKVLIAQSDPRGIKGDVADEYEFRLASFGLDPAQWDKDGPRSHWVAKAWNWYREQGQSLERVHKIMGLIHLEEKFPNMPAWQKREIIRERAGSPDFLQRPASKAAIDSFALFYVPWKEGMRSFVKSAKANPWSFAGKMTMTMALPTILQALAEAGAFGDDLKEQMRSVSDYDATNYLVLPLGWDDKENRKARYFRLPLWEPARVLHGLLSRALTGRGEGYLSFAGGQVPGMNPLIGAAADWATFAIAGKNPYDYFYEGNVLDADKMTANDPSLWVDMLKHTWNELGGGIAYRFRDPLLKQPDPTPLEKALQAPGAGPVVNRFLKVSNRGVIEKDQREVFQPSEEHRAQVRVAVKEILRKGFAAEPLTDAERELLLVDPYATEYWLTSLPDALTARNSFLLDRLQRAPNAEARMQLMIRIMEAGQ